LKAKNLTSFFYDEPLGFEKDPSHETKKIQTKDPLEEIDLGDE